MKARLIGAILVAAVLVPAAHAGTPRVLAIRFGPDLEVNPVTKDYVNHQLSEAEKPVAALRGELSIENARTQLGWEPQYGSIRDGIVQYIEQYRAFVGA